MKKIVTIIGARPQFIKAAPLSRALDGLVQEVVVHTGQHYDVAMSDVFFTELDIRKPEHNLQIGSGSHATQSAGMLTGIERVLLEERPSLTLVYGDTNSTLAGALAAVKLGIPVAHVEAGLRSFNRRMPEEINRVLTDHVATLLFAPSETSVRQLAAEGITEGVHLTGDIMLDATLAYSERAAAVSAYPQSLGFEREDYYLCTVHRAETTDDPEALRRVVAALDSLDRPVVLPLHPRTRKKLNELGIRPGPNVRVLAPVGYLDMLQLQQCSAMILTDSGGVQKEAFYLGVPCVTLRAETEWVETVAAGWNRLAGTSPAAIANAVRDFAARPTSRPALYGDGTTALQIAEILSREV